MMKRQNDGVGIIALMLVSGLLFFISGCAGKQIKPAIQDRIDRAGDRISRAAEKIRKPKIAPEPATPEGTIKLKPIAFYDYTIKSWSKDRECLWNIAQKTRGNPREWPEIYRDNADTISNPDLIHEGRKLRLRK